VTQDQEIPGYSVLPQFRVTMGTQGSRLLRESGVPGDPRNPEFQVTPGTRISGNPETRISGDSGNQ